MPQPLNKLQNYCTFLALLIDKLFGRQKVEDLTDRDGRVQRVTLLGNDVDTDGQLL